jgi:hypothetical protein
MNTSRNMPPPEIVEAAKKVAKWFEERELHNWVLEGCRARYVRESLVPSRGTDLDVPDDWAIESLDNASSMGRSSGTTRLEPARTIARDE